MTQIKALQSAKTLSDVAVLLGYKPKALAYILYRYSGEKYTRFTIPKRSGGLREIYAPKEELKLLQRRLSDLLQNCIEEIRLSVGTGSRKNRISHAFTRDRSIITNAAQHRRKRYVFNVDLRDFFGSINFGRVRGFFLSDKNFRLEEKVATVLAQIACHNNSLPQGSPCSPVISNLIANILDSHLSRLSRQHGCSYTRYADDLTFSTNKKEFPIQIATMLENECNKWGPGKDLCRVIDRSGFSLNETKTRMQYYGSRQDVTGLVVNRKINVRREYRHTVRAMVHRLITKGECALHTEGGTGEVSLLQLHGMLSFIDWIDEYNKKANKGGAGSDQEKGKLIYRKFLIYKEFFAARKPVVICEGKTDNVYLLHAMRQLAERHPILAENQADGSVVVNVRLFKYAGTSTGRILGLGGGTADLAKFIRTYHKETEKFNQGYMGGPVVILADNDGGLGPIMSTIRQIIKCNISKDDDFIRISRNLYLVTTPLASGKSSSAIEDFFDDGTLSTEIDGKKFSAENNYDKNSHYGKAYFAYKVIRDRSDKIDFSGFEGVLGRIARAIENYMAIHPK